MMVTRQPPVAMQPEPVRVTKERGSQRNCSGCSNRSTMAVHTQLYLKDNGKISEFEGSENELPVNTFQLAYLSSTEDLYIVYNKPHTPPNCAVQILEGPEETPLDFIVRSFEGYPKEGIILFGHPSFCGIGQSFPVSPHDIANLFPTSAA